MEKILLIHLYSLLPYFNTFGRHFPEKYKTSNAFTTKIVANRKHKREATIECEREREKERKWGR